MVASRGKELPKFHDPSRPIPPHQYPPLPAPPPEPPTNAPGARQKVHPIFCLETPSKPPASWFFGIGQQVVYFKITNLPSNIRSVKI
jgi:hypothetical protein